MRKKTLFNITTILCFRITYIYSLDIQKLFLYKAGSFMKIQCINSNNVCLLWQQYKLLLQFQKPFFQELFTATLKVLRLIEKSLRSKRDSSLLLISRKSASAFRVLRLTTIILFFLNHWSYHLLYNTVCFKKEKSNSYCQNKIWPKNQWLIPNVWK